jgi:hypothetical protein
MVEPATIEDILAAGQTGMARKHRLASSDVRIPPKLAQLQTNLVVTRPGGQSSQRQVRAMLLLRANVLAGLAAIVLNWWI